MLALVIILLVVVVVELIVCFAIHFDRKKTHAVYTFMADMVSEEGGALKEALEELKETSKYAEPAESAAAVGEIIRFLESFNSTVRKQAERIEEAQKHKWHHPVTGLFAKKKKVDYSSLIKKKAGEKKEAEVKEEEKEEAEETDSELEKIEEKIQEKLAGPGIEKSEEKIEEKPTEETAKPKIVKKLRKRIKKRPKPDAPMRPHIEAAQPKEKDLELKVSGESDTDIDLAPPSEGE